MKILINQTNRMKHEFCYLSKGKQTWQKDHVVIVPPNVFLPQQSIDLDYLRIKVISRFI